MAASEETCDGNPNFAIICSFISKFGDDCGVNISIPHLQQMLEDTKNVNEDLQELLIHLLRRGRKRVNKERWEKCLIKFCHEYSSVDAWELERFGFTKSKLSVKLEILKRLLELQFDANAKFKAEVNKLDAGSLRLLPLGRDIEGQAYWYQLDKEYNLRLYRETFSEEEGTWQLVCSNTEDIRKLLSSLEGKYSGSSKDPSKDESKDNDPKSPSPEILPVPKKEKLEGEDLTSHLSESKPCTIIIKTEKRDATSHSETSDNVRKDNSTVEPKKTFGCELDNSTKGCVKLKLKLETSVPSHTEQKATDRPDVECPKPAECEPMEVEEMEAPPQPKDAEMAEKDPTSKVESEEQNDQNISVDKPDSVNHPAGENESNSEVSRLNCANDCSTKESDPCPPNQKSSPTVPEQCHNTELSDAQSEKCVYDDAETAVDLSKSSRVNVIVQNMCSKPASTLNSKEEKESVKKFDSNKEPELSVSTKKSRKDLPELKNKPVESESTRVHSRSESHTEKSAVTKKGFSSGFSHLQALQNMCETNAMGGIPSVIQSTNHHCVETNRTVISENKSVTIGDVRYENVSRQYNFNEVHCSNGENLSLKSDTTSMLLKSNVTECENNKQSERAEDLVKIKFAHSNASANEPLSFQEAPTNLSFSASVKSDSCELKPDKNTNTFSKLSMKTKDISPVKEIHVNAEHAPKLPPNNSEADLKISEDTPRNGCDSVDIKEAHLSLGNKSVLLDNSTNCENNLAVKDLGCSEKKGGKNDESAIKVSKSDSCSAGVSAEHVDPKKVRESVLPVVKDVSKVVKDDDKCVASVTTSSESVRTSSIICTSPDKIVREQTGPDAGSAEKSKNESSERKTPAPKECSLDLSKSRRKEQSGKLSDIVNKLQNAKAENLVMKSPAFSHTKGKESGSVPASKDTLLKNGENLKKSEKCDHTEDKANESGIDYSMKSSSPDTVDKRKALELDFRCDKLPETKEAPKDEVGALENCKKGAECGAPLRKEEKVPNSEKVVNKLLEEQKDCENISEKESKSEKEVEKVPDVIQTVDKVPEKTIDEDKITDSKEHSKTSCEQNSKEKVVGEDECEKESEKEHIKKSPCEEKTGGVESEKKKLEDKDEDVKGKSEKEEKMKKSEAKDIEKISDNKNDIEGKSENIAETKLEEEKNSKDDCSKKTDKELQKKEKSSPSKISDEKLSEISSSIIKPLEKKTKDKEMKKDKDKKTSVEEKKITKESEKEKLVKKDLEKNSGDEKVCGSKIDDGELSETKTRNDRISKKSESKKKESRNCKDSKKALQCDKNVAPELESEKMDIPENETDDVKNCVVAANENKTSGLSDDNEKSGDVEKLKACSVEKEENDEKSKRCEIDTSESKSNENNDNEQHSDKSKKDLSLQKEDDKKNSELSKCESQNESNEEKSEVSIQESSDKCDKDCSPQIDSKSEKVVEKSPGESSCDPPSSTTPADGENKVLESKRDEKGQASDKDVEMCDVSAPLKEENTAKPEVECKAPVVPKVPRSRKSRGRRGFAPRRKAKDSSIVHPDTKDNCDTDLNANKCEDAVAAETTPSDLVSPVPETQLDGVSSSKSADISCKSSDIFYEERWTVYNLRHSICLETKLRHPFCDKPFKRSKDPPKEPVSSSCDIEMVNEESLDTPLANSRRRSRGTHSKQAAGNKKAPPAPKPSPPPKKTPEPNARKKAGRNRKKVDSEKDDFAIPEGFLEILDNAGKVAPEKETSVKKRKGFELRETSSCQNSDSESSQTPIKRSRRIQEQHQKKMTELAVEMEREQRILEQLAKRSNSAKKNPKPSPQKPVAKQSPAKPSTPKKASSTPTKSPKAKAKIQTIAIEEETCMESRRATRKMNCRSKNLTKMTLMYEDESKDSQFSTSRETEKSKRRRRRRGKRTSWAKPWDLSSESESSIEELTEEEEEEEPDEPLIFDQNEDEFACEEVDPNAEPVIVRRARTAKKTLKEDTAAEEECVNDDTPCQKCGKYDKPEWILLCDKCDSGYHTHCLQPPLMIVPDGDWFCQPCEHMSLCQCLHEELNRLEVILKQKEREALRKQRLAYVGISLDNVLKPEKKEKSDESEKEEVKEEEEVEDVERKPQRVKEEVEDERHQKLYGKRSVRARRTVNYQFKEYDALIASALQEEMLDIPEDDFKEEGNSSGGGSDKPFTAKVSKRKKRGRRWKDFDSTDEEEDSQDDYQGASTDSEATMPPSSRSDQESGSGEWKISTKSKPKRERKAPRSRRRRRTGDYSSEEEWEDEVVEKEVYRPAPRRASQKAVSYRELSSDDEEWGPKTKPAPKRRKATSSESESSFKKKPSKKKRIRKWESSNSSESEEEKSFQSSSEGESEEENEESQEDESEKEWKVDRKEKMMRLKANTNKKVLSTDEEEGESSTQDSAPKKKPKKVISDESEEEEEEEDDDEEEEDEEGEEEESESEENSEEEDEEPVKKTDKKIPSEKDLPKVPNGQNMQVNNCKSGAEKENLTEKEEIASVDQQNISVIESSDFQPKVLIKKELCSVDIPLEPNKHAITITPVVEKAPQKTVRKDATKMVPCVIPYDKSSPKSGPISNPEEEYDKEVLREDESLSHPAHFPKQKAHIPPPPSSRIQFGGAVARHPAPLHNPSARPPAPASSIPPMHSPSTRPLVPAGNIPTLHNSSPRPPAPPRMFAPTNLSARPPPSVVVRHSTSPGNMPGRPAILPANVPATQTKSMQNKPYKSTIMEPFSNMEDDNESDDEVPLERIPTACPPAPPNRPAPFEKEAEYRPAAKELSTYSFAPPEEKPFPGSYSNLVPFQDYSTRPSPLKPSLVETYPNNSSPSKLTPLDTYSQSNSPKGFISLDSYSENRKKKHFLGSTSAEGDTPRRPAAASSEPYQGGEIRFPPEPYPCPPSPSAYPNRSPSPAQRDPGTPPRLYSQFPDAYAPPRSPEYYQNHQYYASEERIPRPSYQPNYAPQEPSFVSNPYVATPVPQPNGGFMIDTLLRARNPENEEDELTGVTDIVSYITQE